MFRKCLENVQKMSKKCLKNVQKTPKKCSEKCPFFKILNTLYGLPHRVGFLEKNGQSTFNFLSRIMFIINKNGQSNFFLKQFCKITYKSYKNYKF